LRILVQKIIIRCRLGSKLDRRFLFLESVVRQSDNVQRRYLYFREIMSLCVAWKYEEKGNAKIHFAADSCVVYAGFVMPYSGIKVLQIPVRVISPMDKTTGRHEMLFETSYGMAFAGSYASAFLIKEMVAEVLSHIQYLRQVEDFSFDKVCELVHEIHKDFHEKIRDDLKGGSDIDFFLGGYCPKTNKVRVAKYFVEPNTFQAMSVEILRGGGFCYETVGNPEARDRFHALMQLSLSAPPCRTHFATFRRLQDIIRDKDYDRVDGAIQYGEFTDKDFHLFGSISVELKDGVLDNRKYIRGLDLDAVHNPFGIDDLHVSYTYGHPFVEDIKAFDPSSSYVEANGVRYVPDEQITFYPHNPKWLDWFVHEKKLLQTAFGPLTPIEHVGSTCIPDLAAVPHLDVLVGLENLEVFDQPPLNLKMMDYEFLGRGILNGEVWYRKRGPRPFNLRVVTYNGDAWKNHIATRDFLKANAGERAAFNRARMEILNQGSWTLIRYQKAKADVHGKLLSKALAN
jgi:GrpB-like predicted nucleotidyltransferase (UPF0157 family)